MGDTSMAGLAVRLVGSLAVVVGLLFLLARLANRRFTSSSNATVSVVHRQALSRGAAVTVLTVGARVLVVGTTEQQVTLLAELDPEELALDLPEDLEQYAEAPVPLRTPSHRADVPVDNGTPGPLAGSILSPATWKQTMAALKRAS